MNAEERVSAAAVALTERGEREFTGFALAKEAGPSSVLWGLFGRSLMGYGTLYLALHRLEQRGVLESRWESFDAAAKAGRPRRRYYRLAPQNLAAGTG